MKRLSETGELAKYRMVHFATHGALAGELGKGYEPGLILTPPATATEDDDTILFALSMCSLMGSISTSSASAALFRRQLADPVITHRHC